MIHEKCAGCVYFASSTESCDYIFIEDRMRPCDPGDACTVRKTPKELKMSKAKWDTHKAQRMHEAGYSDRDIAKEVGVSAANVSYYRRKHWVTNPREGEPDGTEEREPGEEARPDHGGSGGDRKMNRFEVMAAATGGLSGIRAVCTAEAICALWGWTRPEDLMKAKAAIDYLLQIAE